MKGCNYLDFIGFWNGEFYVLYFPDVHYFWSRGFDIGFNGRVISGKVFFSRDIFDVVDKRKEEFLEKRVDLFLKRPVILSFFIITNKCNLNCEFCYAHANSDLSEPRVGVDDFKFLFSKGVKFSGKFGISGGEPLLYFDLISKIYDELLEGTNVSMEIYTNGLLLNDEILRWMRDRRVYLYMNMDFDREGVRGHLGEVLREKIERFVKDYPWFVERIENSVVLYPDEILSFDKLRKRQVREFELGVFKFYNFARRVGRKDFGRCSYVGDSFDESLIRDGFLNELNLVEKGEVNFNLSLFVRFLKSILVGVFLGGWNLMSCDSSVTLRYDRKMFLCHVVASNVLLDKDSVVYKKNFVCELDDFSRVVYRNKLLASRVWVRDCILRSNCLIRWFCGEICWSNLDCNRFLCYVYKWGLLGALYLIVRYRKDLFSKLLMKIGSFDVDVEDISWEVLIDGS